MLEDVSRSVACRLRGTSWHFKSHFESTIFGAMAFWMLSLLPAAGALFCSHAIVGGGPGGVPRRLTRLN